MSNFLGNSGALQNPSSLISTAELMAREGVNMQKGMNFRKDGLLLSVFLVLPTHEGEYADEWNAKKHVYTFEGHDSTTIEAGGKTQHQLLMYESGKLTENGKFYKAANEYKDGLRKTPLQVQVYEKLDAGVWYDKGIFELVDVRCIKEGERKIYKFDLDPAGEETPERMMSVVEKIVVWQSDKGRCHKCKVEDGLRFVSERNKVHLLCKVHRGESGGLLG